MQTGYFIQIWMVLNLCCYALIFCLSKIAQLGNQRSIVVFILAVILLSSLQYYFGMTDYYRVPSLLAWDSILAVIWVICSAGLILKAQLKPLAVFAVMLFGIVLSLMGYFEIYLLILLMAWAIHAADKLIYACVVVMLIYLLWQLYYLLALSFLFKALSIFISGLLLLVLQSILKKNQLENTAQEQLR